MNTLQEVNKINHDLARLYFSDFIQKDTSLQPLIMEYMQESAEISLYISKQIELGLEFNLSDDHKNKLIFMEALINNIKTKAKDSESQ